MFVDLYIVNTYMYFGKIALIRVCVGHLRLGYDLAQAASSRTLKAKLRCGYETVVTYMTHIEIYLCHIKDFAKSERSILELLASFSPETMCF